MRPSGPSVLGRGVVITAGSDAPRAWSGQPRIVVSSEVLNNEELREEILRELHVAWVTRRPTVVEWNLPFDRLPDDEAIVSPVWHLDAGFLPPMERLAFLVFSNNYDARQGERIWYWSRKAEANLAARPSTTADVLLPDGTHVWIDGGPRQSLPVLDHPVISGESVELGKPTIVPPPRPPSAGGLAPDQLDAVGHLVGASRVIAPAGSGKTRTMVARLRHLLDERRVEPEVCVTLAYNREAASELRSRVGSGQQSVRTIHSLGWQILQSAHGRLELIDEREVRSRLARLISVPRRANTDPIAPYLEALEQVRVGLEDPMDVEQERDDVTGFADAFDRYRSQLYASRRVDHGEQVYGAIEALLGDAGLRRTWQARSRHVLVDEFQDLTPAYLLLIRLLASPRLQVFGVGDDDQVIYGHAGADPGFLIDFDRYFPGAQRHALETNYRCPAPIVTAAAHLLSYNRRRIDKTIVATSTASRSQSSLQVVRIDSDTLAEAAADQAESWLEAGVEPRDIAVLARVNSSLIPVKAALTAREVPVNDVLDTRLLDRTVLRALFAWIRIGLDPDDILAGDALEAVRRPARGLTTVARDQLTSRRTSVEAVRGVVDRLGSKQAKKWRQFVDDIETVASLAAGNDAAEVLEFLIDDLGLGSSAHALDSGRRATRASHFDELTAVRRAARLHRTLDDLEPWLHHVLDRPSRADGIKVSSIHRVKGMEWKKVIVFSADRGSIPHDLAEDMEEERRVFHVALTRAIDQAVILASKSHPTRFLAELDGSADRAPKPASPTRAKRPAVAAIGDTVRVRGGYEGEVSGINERMVLVRTDGGVVLNVSADDVRVISAAPSNDTDPALVESLRTWRRQTSQRLGLPAFVVFDDKTMHAIAAAVPADESELIAVPGIGPAKLEAYGDEILALVQSVTD